MKRELEGEKPGIPLHISAGICQAAGEITPSQAFIHADKALYQAKREGKAWWVVYG